MITTPGRLMLLPALPEQYRNIEGALDKKAISALFTRMAEELPPDEYRKVLFNVNKVANNIAHLHGKESTVHLRDFILPSSLRKLKDELKSKIYKIQQDRTLSSEERRKEIIRVTRNASEGIDKQIVDTLAEEDNPLGIMVKNGIRGNPSQLRQIVFGDLLTVDSNLKTIPAPGLKSYAEGVTPMEYWSASHGGRQGYVGVQKATADAGYLSSRVRQIAHKQVVTSEDCEKAKPYMVDADDSDNIGSLLQSDVKGISGKVYKADSLITKKVLEDLTGDIPIRSSITCGNHEGVCAKCAGIRESNKLGRKGEAIGINAVNAWLEGVTQAGLCLHEDTLVRMVYGEPKPLKDVEAGDWVYGATRYGYIYPTQVVAKYNNGIKEVFKYTFKSADNSDYTELVCTSDHKILAWEEGSACLSVGSISRPTVLPIGEAERIHPITAHDNTLKIHCRSLDNKTLVGPSQTYDIEVDTPDHLFVLANGLIVSNSSKHSGGEERAANRVKSGLNAVTQFIDMPETFVGGAVVATADGVLSKPVEAPQGGFYVSAGDVQYHVPPYSQLLVKPGKQVYAGDVLTDGMVDVSKITEHKGIGEGRKAFTEYLRSLLLQNGAGTMRRNLESVARGYISKVKITDPDGVQGRIAGDIMDYDELAGGWKPREGAAETSLASSLGKYLEEPVLHYSIGTRVIPEMLDNFQKYGIHKLKTHTDAPPFRPIVIPAKQFVSYDDDFITSLAGENLMRTFQRKVTQGADSDKHSISYYPQAAFASYEGDTIDVD